MHTRIALAALVILATGCAVSSDPRGQWWGLGTSCLVDVHERGPSFCESRQRPWSQRLAL